MLTRTIYDEEHEMFRNTVRAWAEKEVYPHAEKWREDSNKWKEAMPVGIGEAWDSALGFEGSVDSTQLETPLKETIPDETQRIKSLLRWYGSGSGPWSGYPSYEEAAAGLLQLEDREILFKVIQQSDLTPTELEGAARFLVMKRIPSNSLDLISESTKSKLLAQVISTGQLGNITRAESAFRQFQR